MSVMLAAASCLPWASGLVGAANAGELEHRASQLDLKARAQAPVFLPYLSGERTPHNDAPVRGSLHGLGFDTDAAALGYGVMEGVAFGLKDDLVALNAAGRPTRQRSSVGGGTRSGFWVQMLASALNVTIVSHGSSAAGSALGAARLAWLSAGGAPEAVCRKPEVSARYEPEQAEQALLSDRYARFRRLYQPADTAR